jgi:hypothetical protein
MSSRTVALYQRHREERGLPPTVPPPAALADDMRRAARKATAVASHVLALANETDRIAASALRRIGSTILDDAQAIERVANAVEGR